MADQDDDTPGLPPPAMPDDSWRPLPIPFVPIDQEPFVVAVPPGVNLTSVDHDPFADDTALFQRTHPLDRLSEGFQEPLGPSDAFLDRIGLSANGASGILRPPARALLTAGDVAGRVVDAGMKTGADLTGDIAAAAARAAPGLFGGDPSTIGNQAQRDAYGMMLQAGLSGRGRSALARGLPEAAGTGENMASGLD